MIKTSTMMFLTQSVDRHVIKFHKVAVSLTLLLSINEYLAGNFVSGGSFTACQVSRLPPKCWHLKFETAQVEFFHLLVPMRSKLGDFSVSF